MNVSILSNTDLFEVFVLACLDQSAVPPLLAVCKTVHSWMLPFLYHSITFTKAAQLSKFLSSHDIPGDPVEARFALVRNMYIGRTHNDCGDLVHGSTDWPLTVISRILWLSTALTHLTIVGLDQNKWHLLEHAVPASLEFLSLGPVHGPFRPQALARRPRLRSFTSAATYMRDDEVRDTVCWSTMRVVRRLYEAVGITARYAAEQVGCVAWTETLERLEVVVYGGARAVVTEATAALRKKTEAITQDKRVVVSEDARAAFIQIFCDEWEECRLEFVGMSAISGGFDAR